MSAQTTVLTVSEIQRRAVPILVDRHARRAGVFGSAARGDMGPDSDIDILVDLEPELSLLEVIALTRELEQALDRSVDLVEYDTVKSRIRDQVFSEEVRIL